jgi:hypothetical protein
MLHLACGQRGGVSMKNRSATTGALLGIAGGVAGLVAMHFAMKGARRLLGPAEGHDGRRETLSPFGDQRRKGESTDVATGRIVFTTLMRREPGGREKELMARAVHWGYGLALAAGYGALRGRRGHPMADLLGGTLFGVGLWGLGDELLVPLAGLGDKPTAVPMKAHARALAAHVGYGVATAASVQGLARLLEVLEERRRRGRGLLPSRRSGDLRERLAARFRHMT